MPKIITVALLVFTMLCWGANFYVVKIALEYYSPESVATWRFFFGVLTLLIIVGVQFREKIFEYRFSAKEWWYIFLTSFFGIFLTIYFFNIGLTTTSAINGSLIIATGPAITAIFAYFLLQKRFHWLQSLAILISFLGVAIILVKGDLAQLAQLQFEQGDIYIMLMAIVFSLSQIIVSKYLAHIDSIVLTTITSFIGLLLFGVFSVQELATVSIPSDIGFWASVLFMGVLGTGVAYTAFFYCIVELGATTTTLYMNLIPLFTVLLAFPFGEIITSAQLFGGGIVIAGLLLFGLTGKRKIQEKPSR